MDNLTQGENRGEFGRLRLSLDDSIQFNSIKVNPSISTKEPDGDSTLHAYDNHTTIIQQVKEPADILYQIHR